MAIRGKIIVVGQLQSGTKKDGNPWNIKEYVLETEGQYPTKVAFQVMNAKIEQFNINMGDVVEIEVDARSREYNGKWYTSLTAYRCNNMTSPQQRTAQSGGYQQSTYQQQAPAGYQSTTPPPPGQYYQGNGDTAF